MPAAVADAGRGVRGDGKTLLPLFLFPLHSLFQSLEFPVRSTNKHTNASGEIGGGVGGL